MEMDWVTIPAGDFLMGAQRKDPLGQNYDFDAWSDESPVHEVHLSAYRIGRYPVTVAEYKRFMDEGGYKWHKRKEYWEAGGCGWWAAPADWDEQLGHPKRPVVYVSWYEAAAYAAWAGFRLPTEAEWERAARGTEGRRYPWGNDKPNSSRANYDEGKVGHPTPVGAYPRGATPDGIQDMAGNVWEWCQDVWHDDYEGALADGSAWMWTISDAEASRVHRGGSWYSYELFLRSTYRSWNWPGDRYGYIGFRVASTV